MLALNLWNLNLRTNWKQASRLWKKWKNTPHRKTRNLFSWIKVIPARTDGLPLLKGACRPRHMLLLGCRKGDTGKCPVPLPQPIPASVTQCRGAVQRILTFKALEEVKVFIPATVTRSVTTLVTLKLGGLKHGPKKHTPTVNWGLHLFLCTLKKQKASHYSSHLDFEKKNESKPNRKYFEWQ